MLQLVILEHPMTVNKWRLVFVDYHNSRVAKTKYVVLCSWWNVNPRAWLLPFEILCVLSLNTEDFFCCTWAPVTKLFISSWAHEFQVSTLGLYVLWTTFPSTKFSMLEFPKLFTYKFLTLDTYIFLLVWVRLCFCEFLWIVWIS